MVMPPQPMIISASQHWSDGPMEGDEEDGSEEDNTSEDEGNEEDDNEGNDSEQDCMFVFFHDILLFLISLFPQVWMVCNLFFLVLAFRKIIFSGPAGM